jgi:hypothetical protein
LTSFFQHGRVAQLCRSWIHRAGGIPIGLVDIAPGLAFADIPHGVAAIDAIPALGWAQIFFFIGAVDYYGFPR